MALKALDQRLASSKPATGPGGSTAGASQPPLPSPGLKSNAGPILGSAAQASDPTAASETTAAGNAGIPAGLTNAAGNSLTANGSPVVVGAGGEVFEPGMEAKGKGKEKE